jgi:hypothetical protein
MAATLSVAGNSVKEALQALGDPWMERKSRGDA